MLATCGRKERAVSSGPNRAAGCRPVVITMVIAGLVFLGAAGGHSLAAAPLDSPSSLDFSPVTPRSPTIGRRVDRAFAAAVDRIAAVLFHEIFAQTQQYIELDHVEHYYRPVGSAGDYLRHDPRGSFPKDSLNDLDVEALERRGRLRRDAAGSVGRAAERGGESVEVISVDLDIKKTQYVLDPATGEFRKKLEMRGLISPLPDDALAPEEVRELASLGRLKSGGPIPDEPWLLQRRVNGAPIVVLWLALGAVFFTFYMGWFNVWGFAHALDVVRGRYDNPDEPGEVTHFQALASALSATVGLGNIAGVTIAMTSGGPGAFFWMLAFGVMGMCSKFVECTLGQKYRQVKADGTVLGGPMQYLHVGLAELGIGPIGWVLSIVFAIMCILASFGGGNMFQANQSGSMVLTILQARPQQQLVMLDNELTSAAEAGDRPRVRDLEQQSQAVRTSILQFDKRFRFGYGLVLAFFVGIVIVGGIRRIGAAAEKVVPAMCVIYVLSCLWIILLHVTQIPSLMFTIVSDAFSGQAMGGGLLGVLVMGVRRAAFSNEAGVGSAAIAHSAAKTDEPIREGAVALLGPFIDTVVVCSMTALVILITGAWDNNDWVVIQQADGAALTALAFRSQIGDWYPYVLAVAVVLFAYSTIISWSYYGEQCWERLFGARTVVVYRCVYVLCVLVGSLVNLGSILEFSDMMILSMAFPNVFGCLLLCPSVRRDLKDYWRRYRAGEFRTFR